MTAHRIQFAAWTLALGLFTSPAPLSAADAAFHFPACTYVLVGTREPATGKHAVTFAKPFSLPPGLYVLSGGPDPSVSILVDDDLELSAGSRKLFIDDDHVATTDMRGSTNTYPGYPIILALRPGAKLRVQGIDTGASDAIFGDLYAHRHDGANVQLIKTIRQRSKPKLPDVFLDREFDLDKRFEAPAEPRRIPTEAELASSWSDLGGEDTGAAYLAFWQLAAFPRASVSYLRGKLKPVAPADPQRLLGLLGDLDDPRYRVREEATRRLMDKEKVARPALERRLEERPSAEQRRRVEYILGRLRRAVFPPQTVSAMKAVELLEYVGTPEARELLEAVAKGADEARVTKDARAALERLNRPR
jgi:hypothetical protein